LSVVESLEGEENSDAYHLFSPKQKGVNMKRPTSIATLVTLLAMVTIFEKSLGASQAQSAAAAIAAEGEAAETQTVAPNVNSEDYLRSLIGLRLAPVQLTFGNRNHLMVGLGSYLVNQVASCNDCHTTPSFAPGHDPFLGQPKQINAAVYLAGGHSYPADDGETVFPPNITPDSTGKPGGLTYRQFLLAMRFGQDPAANRLLQVMPWPSYQDLTHRDLRAIYEYLSSIPSLPCNGPGC
jgi:hypothetical protein